MAADAATVLYVVVDKRNDVDCKSLGRAENALGVPVNVVVRKLNSWLVARSCL